MRRRFLLAALLAVPLAMLPLASRPTPSIAVAQHRGGPRFAISFSRERSAAPLDGRLLLLISADSSAEPRRQIADGAETQLVFGIDVDGVGTGRRRHASTGVRSGIRCGASSGFRRDATGSRRCSTGMRPSRRADGQVVKLPPDMGEGQQWNRKPGNLYSTPRWIGFDPKAAGARPDLSLDQEIPPIPEPPETKYIKHITDPEQTARRRSGAGRCSWPLTFCCPKGSTASQRPLPAGDQPRPFPRRPSVGSVRSPPIPTCKPSTASGSGSTGYNRIQQEHAYQFYEDWTGPGFPACC